MRSREREESRSRQVSWVIRRMSRLARVDRDGSHGQGGGGDEATPFTDCRCSLSVARFNGAKVKVEMSWAGVSFLQ
jgi:hypothetical protein